MKVLSYTTNNIGDDMQSYVMKSLLERQGFKVEYLPRAALANYTMSQYVEDVDLPIVNAFMPVREVPQDRRNVVYLSISCRAPLSKSQVKHLEFNQPIGCRDTATLRRMQKHGIPAFYVGCPTILWSAPTQENNGLSVDTQPLEGDDYSYNTVARNLTPFERRVGLERRVELIQQAMYVRSTRLHVIGPALGLGKPVFLDYANASYNYRLDALPSKVLDADGVQSFDIEQEKIVCAGALTYILGERGVTVDPEKWL